MSMLMPLFTDTHWGLPRTAGESRDIPEVLVTSGRRLPHLYPDFTQVRSSFSVFALGRLVGKQGKQQSSFWTAEDRENTET